MTANDLRNPSISDTIHTSVPGTSLTEGVSIERADNGIRSVLLYLNEGDVVAKTLGQAQLLDLSRQQRNLLLMRPVFELESRKMHFSSSDEGPRLFEKLDTSFLILSLHDHLMEGVAVDVGRTTNEVIYHLAEVVMAVNPELQDSECIRVAEIVLDAMANRNDKYRDFEYEYFDAPTRTTQTYRFKLIDYKPDIQDVFRFVPTSQGYLVYLGMLDLAPEDAAELMEKMLQLLIERGRFVDAIEIAKKARTISIELSQKIREMILRARRAPSTVNWKAEIQPRLADSRLHVINRQREDMRMTESVQQSLKTTYEYSVRQSLVHLRNMLQSAGTLRTRLLQDIMVAPEQFMEAQRSLFKVKTASNLPDLENLLLPEVMKLPLLRMLLPRRWKMRPALSGLYRRRRDFQFTLHDPSREKW